MDKNNGRRKYNPLTHKLIPIEQVGVNPDDLKILINCGGCFNRPPNDCWSECPLDKDRIKKALEVNNV